MVRRAVKEWSRFGEWDGVRFTTDQRERSEGGRILQAVQAKLARGKVLVGPLERIAQLQLAMIAVSGDQSYAVVTLWVPLEQNQEATNEMIDHGFSVEDRTGAAE